MSDVLQNKMQIISDNINDLKIGLMSNGINVSSTDSLALLMEKAITHESEPDIDNKIKNITTLDLTIQIEFVDSANPTIQYEIIDNTSLKKTVNGKTTVLTGNEYNNEIVTILSYYVQSSTALSEMIDNQELLDIICGNTAGSNKLCEYYVFHIKSFGILNKMRENIAFLIDYADQINADELGIIKKPNILSIKKILNDMCDSFHDIDEKVLNLSESIDLLFDNSNILNYLLICPNVIDVFNNLFSNDEYIRRVFNSQDTTNSLLDNLKFRNLLYDNPEYITLIPNDVKEYFKNYPNNRIGSGTKGTYVSIYDKPCLILSASTNSKYNNTTQLVMIKEFKTGDVERKYQRSWLGDTNPTAANHYNIFEVAETLSATTGVTNSTNIVNSSYIKYLPIFES